MRHPVSDRYFSENKAMISSGLFTIFERSLYSFVNSRPRELHMQDCFYIACSPYVLNCLVVELLSMKAVIDLLSTILSRALMYV